MTAVAPMASGMALQIASVQRFLLLLAFFDTFATAVL